MKPYEENQKFIKLKNTFREMGSTLVAYSGGVDSTFLLKVASDALKGNVLAVTAKSPTYPSKEIRLAQKICKQFKVKHVIISTNELSDKNFTSNPPERCYHCKKELFSRLTGLSRKYDLNCVSEGSNFDDINDFRPGTKAITELGIRSPLKDCKLTKDEIRQMSKNMGLPTWNKPSFACLSSRFPYGTAITKKELAKVSRAEDFLSTLGFKQLRIRVHGDMARIEIPEEDINIFNEKGLREKVVNKLKTVGYNYIALDLQGYRTGSMNETLKREKCKKKN